MSGPGRSEAGAAPSPMGKPPSPMVAAGAARVELHIEELVLHGFAPRDSYRIGDAVQAELERLFDERGVPGALMGGGELGGVDGGVFQVAPGARADAVGAQVARAVYGGLGR